MKKRLLPLLLGLVLLTGCAAPAAAQDYRQVSMKEAIALMESEEDYLILDVRTAEEYAAGHIPGAVNLPNEDISAQTVSILPEPSQLILVYCRSGNRSKQASRKLAQLGYGNVVEFGGINSWPGQIVTD